MDSPKINVRTNKIQHNPTFNCRIAGFLAAINLAFDINFNFKGIIFLSCTRKIIWRMNIVLQFDNAI